MVVLRVGRFPERLNHHFPKNKPEKLIIHQMEHYTYHQEKIKIIGIIPYQRLNYYLRKYGRKKRNYFITLWINSICNIFNYLSVADIYSIIKSMGCELDDQLIIDLIKNYDYNNSPHFYIFTHFEWNKENLYKTYKNKNDVDRFKRKIINSYSRKKISEEKTNILLNLYEHNKGLSRRDLILHLKKKMCYNSINKKLKENDIHPEKKSKSFTLIENKLKDLFQNRIERVNKKMTNQVLAEYIGVSKRTLIRFLKANNDWKEKIRNFKKE
jgi:hypothetical protein